MNEVEKKNLRIVGVTFKNPDGTSRQDIISKLYDKNPIITVDIIATTFEGHKALKCVEHVSRSVLGFIAEKEIDNVKCSQMTGFIRKSKYGYSIILDEAQKPTSKMYWTMKNKVNSAMTDMPTYDKRAYAIAFAKLK